MRLTALKAKFIGMMGEKSRIAVMMNCPCGCEHKLYIPFANPIGGGKPDESRVLWQRTGETIDTLTLSPSVQRTGSCPKLWHGWIRNGEAVPA
jgi:hypothetical protein